MARAAAEALQLVLNVGSSSVKYALYRSSVGAGAVAFRKLISGIAEGIGTESHCRIKHETEEGKQTHQLPLPDHRTALASVMGLFSKDLLENLGSVGHRVVHGGEAFFRAAVVDEKVIEAIEKARVLAPLHNPWGLLGIRVSQELVCPNCPQVAVFDTAFHQTLQPHVFLYALPTELYEKHQIRKYGFHGTSYQYVLGKLAEVLGKPVDQVNCIACHIGNGASMCAIRKGRCVDTSMGLTPCEGLVMGTRTGDMDPAVMLHLMQNCGYTLEQVADVINKKSGLFGLCGTSDDREIEERYLAQDPRATLAKKVQIHRMRKYLGAYLVALDGEVDALVFCGGMGEKAPMLRTLVCEDLARLGLNLDESRNQALGGRFDVSTPIHKDGKSAIQIWVIPTDEELCIAQQAHALVHQP